MNRSAIALFVAATLTACGGGDSGNDNSNNYQTCSATDQNIRFYNEMTEDYYWASELPDEFDPTAYADIYATLEALRVPQDRFSYILTEDEYESLIVNAEYIGFGFSQQQVDSSTMKLRFVYENSPAWQAGLRRADQITAIDGVAVKQLLNSGNYEQALGDNEVGITRTIEWQRPDGQTQSATLSKDYVATNSVMGTTVWSVDEQTIGYFTLDSFINRTGNDLNRAFNRFAEEQVDALVIDVRYNGGGLIRYANQAATQTAGVNVQGKTFIQYLFNEQNASRNRAVSFNLVDGIQQLDLDKVVVLTTAASCSSSELIINSLKPHVEVTVIGQPTCGKPVGQQPTELCDKVIFAINFETLNSAGEGGYFDGIAPTCEVADAIVADWGDAADPLTGAAINYIQQGRCPATSAPMSQLSGQQNQLQQAPVFYNLKQKRASLQ